MKTKLTEEEYKQFIDTLNWWEQITKILIETQHNEKNKNTPKKHKKIQKPNIQLNLQL